MVAKHNGHDKQKDWVITDKVIVGDLLKICPDAEEIFKKHLGSLCLTIPGAKTESIEFLAAMHDYHAYILLEDINSVCKVLPPKIGHF